MSTVNSVVHGLFVPKNNYTATSVPTIIDDDTKGYDYGSRWVDQTGGMSYTCVDPSTGAAVWEAAGGTDTVITTITLAENTNVPAGSGVLFLSYGKAPIDLVEYTVKKAGKITGITLSVDLVDGSRDFDLEITINGAPGPILSLLSGNLDAFVTGLSTAVSAGDTISAFLRRTSGSGKSTFSNIIADIELTS